MKWFTDFKIAQKLISSFIVVALFIGVVGFIGVLNMKKINTNAVYVLLQLRVYKTINYYKTEYSRHTL